MYRDSSSGSEAPTMVSKQSWSNPRDENDPLTSKNHPLERGCSSGETSLSTQIVIAVDVLFFVLKSSDRPVRVKLQPYKKFEWKTVPAKGARAGPGEESKSRSHQSVRSSREELKLGPGGMLVLKGPMSDESSAVSEEVVTSPPREGAQEREGKERVRHPKKSLMSRVRSSERLSRWMSALGRSLSTPSSRIISVATLTILASMVARGQR